VIHDSMTYDPIQDQCHGGLKCVKMANLKGCLLSQKTTVNCDATRQYLNFNRTDLFICFIQSHLAFKLRVLTELAGDIISMVFCSDVKTVFALIFCCFKISFLFSLGGALPSSLNACFDSLNHIYILKCSDKMNI